jgi:hypothetical protein
VVDPAQPTQQSDMEILAVPKALALSIQEIVKLYHQNKQAVLESLINLISDSKSDVDNTLFQKQTLVSYPNILDADNDAEFLKSWDDIFNVQIYIDTDIYGELDSRPPALSEARTGNSIDSETVIQHTEATEAYIQTWKDLAKSMSAFPDDLFTRLWTTIEISKILETSPSTLRRARRSGRLPIKIKNMILDCISHDGKRSLWFVRPS